MKIFTKKISFYYKHKLKKVINYAIKELNLPQNIAVNVVFVDENEIKRLNNDFRNINKITDVLSFPADDFFVGCDFKTFEDKNFSNIFLGDIAICKNVLTQQAKQFNHSIMRELCFLTLHGFLHLLGYDHLNKQDEKVMNEITENILQLSNIRRKNV